MHRQSLAFGCAICALLISACACSGKRCERVYNHDEDAAWISARLGPLTLLDLSFDGLRDAALEGEQSPHLPYSVAELRRAMPLGMRYEHSITSTSNSALDGKIRTTTVVAADEQGLTLAYSFGASEATRQSMTWSEFSTLAEPETLVWQREMLVNAMGMDRECVIFYRVSKGREEVVVYAKSIPGPPVIAELREGGESVSRLELSGFAESGPVYEPTLEAVRAAAADGEQSPPPPFSAADLRKATQPGREYLFDYLSNEEETTTAFTQIIRFTEIREDGCTFLQGVKGDGEPDQVQESRATWEELEGHADFSWAESSARFEATVLVLGELRNVWVYYVKHGLAESIFVFAKDLPGPPALFEHYVADKLITRMALIGFAEGGE